MKQDNNSTDSQNDMKENKIKKLFLTEISLKNFVFLISLSVFVLFILGFFGKYSRLFELFVNFRVQYAVISAFSAVILFFIDRKSIKSHIALITAAVLSSTLIAFYIGPEVEEHPEASSVGLMVKVMSINVNTANSRYEKVIQAVKSEEPDLLVLEEVSEQWIKHLSELKTIYPYSKEYPLSDNFGIAFYTKYPPEKISIAFTGNPTVPYIKAEFKLPADFVFYGVHTLPPVSSTGYKHRNKMLETLSAEISGMKERQVIIAGDFNLTPWSYFFKKFLADSGLKNSQTGFGIQPSWPVSPVFLRIPIDHCFVSESINVVSRKLGNETGSDHFPVIIQAVLKMNLNSCMK